MAHSDETGIARASNRGAGDAVWLASAAALVVAQQVAVRLLPVDGPWEWVRGATFFLTTAAVLVMALHFRRFAGAWIVAAGIVMNFIPMAAHGGLMPISYELVRDTGAFPQITEESIGDQLHRSKDVVLHEEDVRFYALSDRFYLRIPGYGPNIFSAGDFVLAAGFLLTAAEAALLVANIDARGRLRRRSLGAPSSERA